MRWIKTYKIFESAVERIDIEDILLPLNDIGVKFKIDESQILGKNFITFSIDKFKVKALHTIPDYMTAKKDMVYLASFNPKRNSYMEIYHSPNITESVHASHVELIGYKWGDIRDEILHMASFLLEEGYFFYFKNSITVSEIIRPNGQGLTWLEEDVLKKSSGNEIEILESLDPESKIAELKISFAIKK